MREDSETIRAEKIKKLTELRNKGVEPYPYSFGVTHEIQKIRGRHGKLKPASRTRSRVRIAGRIMLKREMGNIVFMDLMDETARIQLFLRKNELGAAFEALKLIDIGDLLGAEGTVFTTKAGELSVAVTRFELLAKSLTGLVDKYHGLRDLELKYRNRSLDMVMNVETREILRKRYLITQKAREFMTREGFLEVETPTLQITYGGAMAKPFITHHHKLNLDLYLRVSLEQNLKRIMAGGMNAVFEIGKCFRNENIDRTHNPEFTMLEAYKAYVDYTAMMELAERLIVYICKEVFGTLEFNIGGKKVSFKRPWRRITVAEALKKYAKMDVAKMSDKELMAAAKKLTQKVRPKNRGEAILHLFEEYCEDKLIQPTHVIEYPKESTPFAKLSRRDPALIERFETFIAGRELANAYSELNDPLVQRRLLEEQAALKKAGAEETWGELDEDFLSAVDLGIPPAGGIGIGMDRLAMVLLDQDSIRDILYFPTMKPRE